ncbi:hypothetical protein U9M48_030566 [Paspalum notatum var. saurae]|uniref:Uncharacterized protein n=1 Tax=Paspalum notatum var. saurae TaxID=547442 RepID=A0AAQ3U5I8_PASNO
MAPLPNGYTRFGSHVPSALGWHAPASPCGSRCSTDPLGQESEQCHNGVEAFRSSRRELSKEFWVTYCRLLWEESARSSPSPLSPSLSPWHADAL